MAKSKYRVTGEVGKNCIKCGKPTEVREHTHISEKQLRQPYYFSKWYNCNNPTCKTSIFMDEKFKVWNRNKAAQKIKEVQEYYQMTKFIQEL